MTDLSIQSSRFAQQPVEPPQVQPPRVSQVNGALENVDAFSEAPDVRAFTPQGTATAAQAIESALVDTTGPGFAIFRWTDLADCPTGQTLNEMLAAPKERGEGMAILARDGDGVVAELYAREALPHLLKLVEAHQRALDEAGLGLTITLARIRRVNAEFSLKDVLAHPGNGAVHRDAGFNERTVNLIANLGGAGTRIYEGFQPDLSTQKPFATQLGETVAFNNSNNEGYLAPFHNAPPNTLRLTATDPLDETRIILLMFATTETGEASGSCPGFTLTDAHPS